MKTNNRPRQEDLGAHVSVQDFLLQEGADNFAQYVSDLEKYIEYLEEQVSDTFAKLVSVEELSKQTIFTLEKENQELKDKVKQKDVVIMQRIQANDNLRLHLQDQFLKVVESVLNKVEIYHFDLIDLENGTTALNQPIITELIQEIKSAIEKGSEK